MKKEPIIEAIPIECVPNKYNICPNATIGEVRKNAKVRDAGVPFYKGQTSRVYKKGNFVYNIDERGNVLAGYLPSFKTELKIMFKWSAGKRKWVLGTYREGTR